MSLPITINADDVGTLRGDVSHGRGDVVLTTTDVVVIVCLAVEGTTVS